MRSFFSCVWGEVSSLFSSSLLSYLVPFALGVAGIGIIVSTYFYVSLEAETLEKEQALAQVATLESTVSALQRTKNADNTIAQIIINQSDLLNSINTQVALEIAGIPTLEWEQNNEPIDEHLGEQSNGKLREDLDKDSTEQKRATNETKTCSIDTPLPHVSAPLLMLYERVSRANTTTAPSMAHANKPFARTASESNDSSSASTMDKRASHDIR